MHSRTLAHIFARLEGIPCPTCEEPPPMTPYTVTLARRTPTQTSAFVDGGTARYGVTVAPTTATCSCPHFIFRNAPCKHIASVRDAIARDDAATEYRPLSTSGSYSYVLAQRPSGTVCVATFEGPDGWNQAVSMARKMNRQGAKVAA